MKEVRVSIIVFFAAGLLLSMPAGARAESFPPLPEALSAMESDAAVTVETKRLPFVLFSPEYYVFKPAGAEPAKGFLLYPGGKVDPRAYAPPARAIAEAGYLVVIVSMPLDLAPFGWRRGNYIMRRYPAVTTWAIGGHSVGGAYACCFAQRYTRKVAGVVIWASTPSWMFRLDKKDIPVISIYGTKDYYPEQLAEGAAFLPPGTPFVVIEGGNHTQFGCIDTSPEPHLEHDYPADISLEEQQRQIIAATVGFLDSL